MCDNTGGRVREMVAVELDARLSRDEWTNHCPDLAPPLIFGQPCMRLGESWAPACFVIAVTCITAILFWILLCSQVRSLETRAVQNCRLLLRDNLRVESRA